MHLRKLAWFLLVILAATAGAGSDSSGQNLNDNTQADRALDGRRVDQITLATADTNAIVTEIAVVTSDCAFRADTSASHRRNVNKVGITQDMPFIGEFFAKTPRQGQLNAGNRIGLAYLESPTLYVDLRQTGGTPTSDRSLLSALGAGAVGGQSAAFAPNAGAPPFAGFSVINRNYQFMIPKSNFAAASPAGTTCGSGAMTKLPLLTSLFAQPVGSAHLLDGQLIVLIKPSIIAGY